MALLSMRNAGLAGCVLTLLLAVGCSPTKVNFDGPAGTVLFVDNKPYHLPAQIELWRPAGAGQSNRYDVSLVTTVDAKEVRAKGYIDVYGFTESDIDKLAVNTCTMEDKELAKLADGAILVFKGQSASRQPIYELNLGKK